MTNYTKKLKHLFFIHHGQGTSLHDPYKDWGEILGGFALVLIIVGIAAAYLYIKVDQNGFITTHVPAAESETIDRDQFTSVINAYKEKEKRYSELKTIPPTIVDPSL